MRRSLLYPLAAACVLTACAGGPGGPPGGGRMAASERAFARDPWRTWAQSLRAEAQALAPQPPARAALDDFITELDAASQLRAARLERGVRGQRLSVSAMGDVGHELRREAEDADDWRAAVQDLRERWERLRAALPAPQLARAEALYLDATRSAFAMNDEASPGAAGGPGGPGGPGGAGRRR